MFETVGDAIIRKTIYDYTGTTRIAFGIIGAVLLFGYGFVLNLAPVEFNKIVGLYLSTLFIMWQITSYVMFKSIPTLPIVIGGLLVVSGGLIITFWKN